LLMRHRFDLAGSAEVARLWLPGKAASGVA
jgi:hypothetical protein